MDDPALTHHFIASCPRPKANINVCVALDDRRRTREARLIFFLPVRPSLHCNHGSSAPGPPRHSHLNAQRKNPFSRKRSRNATTSQSRDSSNARATTSRPRAQNDPCKSVQPAWLRKNHLRRPSSSKISEIVFFTAARSVGVSRHPPRMPLASMIEYSSSIVSKLCLPAVCKSDGRCRRTFAGSDRSRWRSANAESFKRFFMRKPRTVPLTSFITVPTVPCQPVFYEKSQKLSLAFFWYRW